MKIIFVFVITTAFCYCDPVVQRAFTDSQLVPDILDKPPIEFLRVKLLNLFMNKFIYLNQSVGFVSILFILFFVGIVPERCYCWLGRYFDTNTNKRYATGDVASRKWGILYSGKD